MMAYCTAADVRDYLNDDMSSGSDTLLTALIERAQTFIETQTGREFEASADTTRYISYEAVEGQMLWLPDDLCSITTVTNNADGNGDAETLTNGTHYLPVPRHETPYYALKLLSSGDKSWTYTDDRENAITIAGKWAYSETPPSDVKHACIALAGWLYRRRDALGKDTDRPLATGDGVVILDASIPSFVKDVMKKYRRATLWG